MDEGLTTDQDWTQPGATTPPAMPPCPICLGDIDPESQQQHRPHRWPACQHPIHLGCLMHFVTRQARPTCPACRQPWTPEAGQHLDQARAAAQLEWPVPETPADTTAPRDHPPNPPAHIIPLCCPRLALVNPSHPELDASWRELPTRHMEWAPNMDQTTREWQPEWVCLRCNRTVTPNDLAIQTAGPPPICSSHGPRCLAIDVRHNERGWVCSRGFPPHILQCAPARIDTPAPPSAHPAPSRRQWGAPRATQRRTSHTSCQLLVLRSTASCRSKPITSRRIPRVEGAPTSRARMAKPSNTTPGSTSHTVAAIASHPADLATTSP